MEVGMPRAYAEDLRSRVIAAVEAGRSAREAARVLQVSPSAAIKGVQGWGGGGGGRGGGRGGRAVVLRGPPRAAKGGGGGGGGGGPPPKKPMGGERRSP